MLRQLVQLVRADKGGAIRGTHVMDGADIQASAGHVRKVRCKSAPSRTAVCTAIRRAKRGTNSRKSCANRKTGSIFHRALLHGHGYAALSQLKGNRLELSSSSAEIREICEKRDEARAQLGDDAALELSQILADIEAFDTFADFDATFGGQITDLGDSEKCFRMRAGHSIVFRAGHPRNLGAGATPPDWASTTRLKITRIERADA